MCTIAQEVGFHAGVLNFVTGTGYEATPGAAISSHMKVEKVFTSSSVVGLKVMEAGAKSNSQTVTLELGGQNHF